MVFYRGRVQGVGFRYTTQAVATRFAVTGFVQNLPDGRVLVVTEGVEAEIDRFLAAVMEQMGHYVSGVQSNIVPAEGGFRGFSVRF
jgi:acylphosphatase